MSANDHNGNHLPDDNNPTPAEAATSHAKGWLAKLGRTIIGIVPILAIANIAYALIALGIAPKSWQAPATQTAEAALKFPEPISCLVLSAVTLVYWGMRDGRNIPARITMSGIKTWWRKQKAAAWEEYVAEEKAKAHAKGRAEGHAEGRTEGRAEGRVEAYAEMRRNPPPPNNTG